MWGRALDGLHEPAVDDNGTFGGWALPDGGHEVGCVVDSSAAPPSDGSRTTGDFHRGQGLSTVSGRLSTLSQA